MRIDLVGQLGAGEVCASARPAARAAAKANAAQHVKTPHIEALRILALRSLVLSTPSRSKPIAGSTSPNRSRLLPTSVTFFSGRTLAIARFGWGEVGPRQRDGR